MDEHCNLHSHQLEWISGFLYLELQSLQISFEMPRSVACCTVNRNFETLLWQGLSIHAVSTPLTWQRWLTKSTPRFCVTYHAMCAFLGIAAPKYILKRLICTRCAHFGTLHCRMYFGTLNCRMYLGTLSCWMYFGTLNYHLETVWICSSTNRNILWTTGTVTMFKPGHNA